MKGHVEIIVKPIRLVTDPDKVIYGVEMYNLDPFEELNLGKPLRRVVKTREALNFFVEGVRESVGLFGYYVEKPEIPDDSQAEIYASEEAFKQELSDEKIPF